MQDLEKTHLFKCQDAIKQIAKPLFDCSDIGFFSLGRIYKNGSRISLSTCPALVSTLIEQQVLSDYPMISKFMANRVQSSQFDNVMFWFSEESNKPASCIEREYGFTNTLMLLNKCRDHIDCTVFSASDGKNITRDYFSNWGALVNFRNYFLNKATNIIDRANKEKITGYSNRNYINFEKRIMFHAEQLEKMTSSRYYYLNHNEIQYKLTAKQFDCLRWFARGYSRVETAKMMGISPRTIEGYHIRLQGIFNVGTRREMTEIFLASDLKSLS